MTEEPADPIRIHQLRELCMQLRKVRLELPLLVLHTLSVLWHTAPGAERTAGVVDPIMRITRKDCSILPVEQVSAGQDGQNPSHSLKLQDRGKGETAQPCRIALPAGGIGNRSGICAEFLPFVNHPAPPEHFSRYTPAVDPTAGHVCRERPHSARPEPVLQSRSITPGT